MAKRSRRARRQAREEKQEREAATSPDESAASPAPPEEPSTPEPVIEERRSPQSHQDSSFGQEYSYVYTDLRNIVIVAILMVGVLIGLSFVI